MKKILCIILIISMTTVSYAGILDGLFSKETVATNQVADAEDSLVGLPAKLRDLGKKDSIKKFLSIEDESVGEFFKKSLDSMTDEARKNLENMYPNIFKDGIKFDTVEEIYKALADFIKNEVKFAIDHDEITNESINQAKLPLTVFGINVPEINVTHDMPDEELEKLCLVFADALDKISDSFALSLFANLGENFKTTVDNIFKK